MMRRALMVPLLAIALVGCGVGTSHDAPAMDSAGTAPSPRSLMPAPVSLNLPNKGIAVEVGPRRVLLYSLSGHRFARVTAHVANNAASLHPWLVDRFGRELA